MAKQFYKQTVQAMQSFKPKSGKNRHWFYKPFNKLSAQEKQQRDEFGKVFLKEWLQYDLHLEKNG